MATASINPHATYLQILEQARQDFNQSHAQLSDQQRQALWSHISSSNAPNSNNHASLANQVPRSMSYSTASMNQAPTPDPNYMDRTYSAPAYVPAAVPSLSVGNNNNTSAIPQRSVSSSSWQVPVQEQTSEYALVSGPSTVRNPAPYHSNAASLTVSNGSVLEFEPGDYVDRYIDTSNPQSLSLPQAQDSNRLHTQLTIDSHWASSSFDCPDSPPGLMSPNTVPDSDMSRQVSSASQFCEADPMLRIHSNSSPDFSPLLNEDGSSLISFPFNVDAKTISACVDTSLFPFLTGSSSSEVFHSPAHSTPSVYTLGASNDKAYLAEDMWRSLSTTPSESSDGNDSAVSSSSRQLRRDQEIKALASRKIAPKATILDETKSASSVIPMKRVTSEDGSSKDLAQITKTPYIRPHHPKIMCRYCTDRTEGFRGTHELDRHVARVHAVVRKGFICVDNSDNKKFLANCKHCRNKKVYGAYYNAAAHLRRAHFHPRKRGRKGKHDQKRGGIGGGDHPAMDHLKEFWIQEIEVENSGSKKSPSECANSPSNDAADDFDYEAVNDYPQQESNEVQGPFDFIPNQVMYAVEGQYESMPQFHNPSTADFNNFQFEAYI